MPVHRKGSEREEAGNPEKDMKEPKRVQDNIKRVKWQTSVFFLYRPTTQKLHPCKETR